MRLLNPRSLNPSLLNSCFIEGELAPPFLLHLPASTLLQRTLQVLFLPTTLLFLPAALLFLPNAPLFLPPALLFLPSALFFLPTALLFPSFTLLGQHLKELIGPGKEILRLPADPTNPDEGRSLLGWGRGLWRQ